MDINKKDGVEIDSPPVSSKTEQPEPNQNDSDVGKTTKDKCNSRPLPHDATTYELERFEKNALLIFNHNQINGYKARPETEHDVTKLETTFKRFGFEVKVKNDLTKDQLMDALKTFTSQDFSDYGCVGVVVLSYGSHKDGRIKAKDLDYYEADIVTLLQAHHNHTLITKPRLLIVQACRGKKTLTEKGPLSPLQKDLDTDFKSYYLPVEADILVFRSSYPGKRSYGDPQEGSWFIQELCDKINNLSPKKDIDTILTEVNRSIAMYMFDEETNRRTVDTGNQVTFRNQQMPMVTSTLTRMLYFRRFEESPAAPQSISTPPTPTSPSHHTHCHCFLNYFAYIRNILSHYVDDCRDDATAKIYLDLLRTFHESDIFYETKLKTSETICNHLYNKIADNPHLKYVYYYNKHMPTSKD